jgi:hypothetical protein
MHQKIYVEVHLFKTEIFYGKQKASIFTDNAENRGCKIEQKWRTRAVHGNMLHQEMSYVTHMGKIGQKSRGKVVNSSQFYQNRMGEIKKSASSGGTKSAAGVWNLQTKRLLSSPQQIN